MRDKDIAALNSSQAQASAAGRAPALLTARIDRQIVCQLTTWILRNE